MFDRNPVLATIRRWFRLTGYPWDEILKRGLPPPKWLIKLHCWLGNHHLDPVCLSPTYSHLVCMDCDYEYKTSPEDQAKAQAKAQLTEHDADMGENDSWVFNLDKENK